MIKHPRKKPSKLDVNGLPFLSELSPEDRATRIKGEAIKKASQLLALLSGEAELSEYDKKLGYVTVELTSLLLANQLAYAMKLLIREPLIIEDAQVGTKWEHTLFARDEKKPMSHEIDGKARA
jgi:hypothetical protein